MRNRNESFTAVGFIGSYRAGDGLWCREGGNIKGLPVTAFFNDIGGYTCRIRSVHRRVVLNFQHNVRERLCISLTVGKYLCSVFFCTVESTKIMIGRTISIRCNSERHHIQGGAEPTDTFQMVIDNIWKQGKISETVYKYVQVCYLLTKDYKLIFWKLLQADGLRLHQCIVASVSGSCRTRTSVGPHQ